jgi:sugar phosphate isomerase/epimerase
MLQRREFLQNAAAMAACFAAGPALAPAAAATDSRYAFCAFTKYLQALSFADLADAVVNAGFTGVEAPVRAGGHFTMEEAPEKLPEFVAALKDRGVGITILCTDVLRADQKGAEQCLRTAKELGIHCYRMGFYEYDLKQPVRKQLAEIAPALADVAAMNRALGVQAVYQNHSGANMVGAAVWDMLGLLEDISPDEVGLAFDIRHATIEGGLDWPATYNAARDHVRALFVKDFQWRGNSAEHVPLGTGRVDPKFFAGIADSGYTGPISVHVEYLRNGDAAANAAAIARDFVTLKKWLKAAG